ncbi:hypothetical protein RDI58_015459 [Solanum bulbocastanum]|uniref:Uncharacterized protein n=1 Tax=Solanum bulbocastanum TaxID=147425 RepID=A0AAN8THT2_SOLBU
MMLDYLANHKLY